MGDDSGPHACLRDDRWQEISIDTKRPRARRRFHGLQRVARSIESQNRKPMNQDSALLNYLSSNAPSLGIYIHDRSGPPNEDFGRPYSGPRRVL